MYLYADEKMLPAQHQQLIPGLPDDIGLECLSRVPFQFHFHMKFVCHRWHSLISHPSFLSERHRTAHAELLLCLVQALPPSFKRNKRTRPSQECASIGGGLRHYCGQVADAAAYGRERDECQGLSWPGDSSGGFLVHQQFIPELPDDIAMECSTIPFPFHFGIELSARFYNLVFPILQFLKNDAGPGMPGI
ncbi:hypothetical protein RJ639_037234 [Escallonia herrerae]|uniref:F-box domain-containing protein n=1 Tax=Escallonia herrerae TaxID=1293975 RepID=A0AA89B5Z6_9ASTE|nr:hypothetical protein RJ639_037234 [Escallonia herrerae]